MTNPTCHQTQRCHPQVQEHCSKLKGLHASLDSSVLHQILLEARGEQVFSQPHKYLFNSSLSKSYSKQKYKLSSEGWIPGALTNCLCISSATSPQTPSRRKMAANGKEMSRTGQWQDNQVGYNSTDEGIRHVQTPWVLPLLWVPSWLQ